MYWLGAAKDLATTISALVVAVIAIIGINTWKKEIRGRTEFELARRYLGTVYKIRKALRGVRNPFISVNEMSEALLQRGSTEETLEADLKDNRKMNWAVYSVRWDKVIQPLKILDDDLIEAEVVWGKEAVAIVKEFDALVRKFRADLEMFLRGFSAPRYSTKIIDDDVIYDRGEGDDFSAKIEEAIKPVEAWLKPYVTNRKVKEISKNDWWYRLLKVIYWNVFVLMIIWGGFVAVTFGHFLFLVAVSLLIISLLRAMFLYIVFQEPFWKNLLTGGFKLRKAILASSKNEPTIKTV